MGTAVLDGEESGEKIRVDKWLWAARFFKTRSLAAQAVNGGRVKVNGGRVKAARLLAAGDLLEIHRDGLEFVLTVRGFSPRRLSAPAAAELYEEDPAAVERRREEVARRRAQRQAGPVPPVVKPGKRDRRLIRKFTRREES